MPKGTASCSPLQHDAGPVCRDAMICMRVLVIGLAHLLGSYCQQWLGIFPDQFTNNTHLEDTSNVISCVRLWSHIQVPYHALQGVTVTTADN